MSGLLELEAIHSQDVGTVLAAILAASPLPLTTQLGRLARCDLSLRVLTSGERHLSDAEAFRLGAGPILRCNYRHGLLVAPDGLTAASVSLVWLPPRLPWQACTELDKGDEPAGVVLGRYGMRREDRRAMATWGDEEVTGVPAATRSSAVLVVAGVKVGIAEEHVTRQFAERLAAS